MPEISILSTDEDRRAREDAEILRILEKDAAEDQALLDEFSGTMGDGVCRSAPRNDPSA